MANTSVEIVLPAHNEGAAIGETLREFYKVAHDMQGYDVSFLVAEDGSTDDTCEVVEQTGKDIPVRLLSFTERKGYSQAVIDGFRATTGDLVGFIDSDGQCDPHDLDNLMNALKDNDLVIGYRNPRVDPLFRKVMSGAFKFVYERLFPVRLHDPSCPFLIVRREALMQILETPQIGLLHQGFWWEFNARAQALGLQWVEVPVHHRQRAAGDTQVYKLNKIPGIAVKHLRALFTLRRTLQGVRRQQLV